MVDAGIETELCLERKKAVGDGQKYFFGRFSGFDQIHVAVEEIRDFLIVL